jgi:hypothetical protein
MLIKWENFGAVLLRRLRQQNFLTKQVLNKFRYIIMRRILEIFRSMPEEQATEVSHSYA